MLVISLRNEIIVWDSMFQLIIVNALLNIEACCVARYCYRRIDPFLRTFVYCVCGWCFSREGSSSDLLLFFIVYFTIFPLNLISPVSSYHSLVWVKKHTSNRRKCFAESVS